MSSTVTSLRRPTGSKGKPPAETEASANTQKAPTTERVQLPVQVPAEVRRSFKAHAAERDLTMSELFLRMWDDYRARNA